MANALPPPTVMASTSSATGRFSLSVSWENLSYKVGPKEILKNMSGTALASRTLAVMGSSGAGKTTFLNALCGRLREDGECVLDGHRQLNDTEYERKYRKLIGFVTQDDVVGPLATPRSALSFSLRIRRGATTEKTKMAVDEMLEELHLTGCQNTIVGIPGLITGLSGGERKRCNIGIELICDTKILLLDEPTSGLDSVTAAKVVAILSDIARKGRTVIYTIHQPTAEVASFFDDLMLMAAGETVYHGPMAQSVEYFDSVGYTCPEMHTPTDFFMTLLQDESIASKLIDKWKEHCQQHSSVYIASLPRCPPENKTESDTYKYLENYVSRVGSTRWIQATELFKRSFSQVLRNKMYLVMSFVQACFFALIAGLIFLNLGDDVQSIQDRAGLLFMVVANGAFSSVMMMINTFPRDKAVFIREQQAGAYSPVLYFLAKIFSEFPVQAASTFLSCVIVYFMSDLHRAAGNFFYFFAVVTLLGQVGGGIGFAISASVESYVVAAGLAPLTVVPMMLTGGLLANTARIRPYWYWLEKISFVRQGFVLLMKNELESLHNITCDPVKYSPTFCAAQPKNGADVAANYGIDDPQDAIWAMWVSLAILFMLGRFIAVAALIRVAKSKF